MLLLQDSCGSEQFRDTKHKSVTNKLSSATNAVPVLAHKSIWPAVHWPMVHHGVNDCTSVQSTTSYMPIQQHVHNASSTPQQNDRSAVSVLTRTAAIVSSNGILSRLVSSAHLTHNQRPEVNITLAWKLVCCITSYETNTHVSALFQEQYSCSSGWPERLLPTSTCWCTSTASASFH